MFPFLCKLFPPRMAELVAALVYSAVIVVTLYFAFEPRAEFTYLNF